MKLSVHFIIFSLCNRLIISRMECIPCAVNCVAGFICCLAAQCEKRIVELWGVCSGQSSFSDEASLPRRVGVGGQHLFIL